MDPRFSPLEDIELEGLVVLLYHLDRAQDRDGVLIALPPALERASGHEEHHVSILEGENGTRQGFALPVSGFLHSLYLKYVENYYAKK